MLVVAGAFAFVLVRKQQVWRLLQDWEAEGVIVAVAGSNSSGLDAVRDVTPESRQA